ncbi:MULTISPECIES: hypothetical protein [Streptomyces]|uniref:hypothetical protein n=1 Tax=Streptomyces TaxID=1883 RepID=UPI001F328DC2|nr:hypothetical protein [Streptomyces sp. NHF165]
MTSRHSRYGGTPAAPATGDRWSATRLNSPNPLWGSNGVAFGPDGRLYIAQFLAGRISAVDPADGDLEVVVPMDGPVRSPDDLAFGADGSMYIADLVPGKVWRRDPRGVYSVVSDEVRVPNGITCVGDRLFVNEMRPGGRLLELFPDGGEPVVLTEGLALGNAMQRGPDGYLYYPHMVTGQVWRIPPDGGTPELVAEDVHEPVAVRFDQGGVLHVLSRGVAGLVTRIDLHGTGSRSLVTSGITGLDNAAFDAENRMFVSSYASGGINELRPDGSTRTLVPRGLTGPFGVTVDLKGTVYAADHYRLSRPAPDAPAGVATDALMPFAHGIAADSTGLLHLTSQYGDVRTHDPAAGTTRTRASGLSRPTGIDIAPDGTLVVAETDAGRLLTIDGDDTVTVLADGLTRPVDVTHDTEGHCYVSDASLGAVLRVEPADGGAGEDSGQGRTARVTVLADGLDAPHGVAVHGTELFTVESGAGRLCAVSLTTGRCRTEAEGLATGAPPGTAVRPEPALFTHGMPGLPRPFAGLAAAPDGSLLVSADGEGTVLRLTPAAPHPDAAREPHTPREPRDPHDPEEQTP